MERQKFQFITTEIQLHLYLIQTVEVQLIQSVENTELRLPHQKIRQKLTTFLAIGRQLFQSLSLQKIQLTRLNGKFLFQSRRVHQLTLVMMKTFLLQFQILQILHLLHKVVIHLTLGMLMVNYSKTKQKQHLQ